MLLFVGLDGRRRAVSMGAVIRYEEAEVTGITIDGDNARIVLGEEILPLCGVNAMLPAEGTVEVLRLSDGARQLVYAVRTVIDTVTIERSLVSAEEQPGVLGLALVDGEAVEVLDTWMLFSHAGSAVLPDRPTVCRIHAGDAWMQNFLRPLIEQAGYLVVDEHAAVAADISVLIEDGKQPPALAATRTIRLRCDPKSATAEDATIYRYDKDAVLAALAAASKGRAA